MTYKIVALDNGKEMINRPQSATASVPLEYKLIFWNKPQIRKTNNFVHKCTSAQVYTCTSTSVSAQVHKCNRKSKCNGQVHTCKSKSKRKCTMAKRTAREKVW